MRDGVSPLWMEMERRASCARHPFEVMGEAESGARGRRVMGSNMGPPWNCIMATQVWHMRRGVEIGASGMSLHMTQWSSSLSR